MPEAIYRSPGMTLDYTPDSALSAGQVLQLADGRAAVAVTDIAAGEQGAVKVCGVARIAKTASIVLLDGGRAFFDHSANTATFKKVNDRDFYLGVVVGDSASTDTTVDVALNEKQRNLIDMSVDPFDSIAVNNASVKMQGGAIVLAHTNASEAAKIDAMSKDGFAVGSNAIVEMQIEVVSGTNAADDLNVGIASATSATDADAIAESCFIHLDLNSANINSESDDNVSGEVAANDTDADWAAGTRFEAWIDIRDPANAKFYVEGVRVNDNVTHKLSGASGPWYLLAHLEKSSAAAAAEVHIDRLVARIAEQ